MIKMFQIVKRKRYVKYKAPKFQISFSRNYSEKTKMKQNEFEIKDDGYNENLNYGNPLGVHNK